MLMLTAASAMRGLYVCKFVRLKRRSTDNASSFLQVAFAEGISGHSYVCN